MPKREYDPLSVIPSTQAIRQRLEGIQEQARRLKILLRTAEQIERNHRKGDSPEPVRSSGAAR